MATILARAERPAMIVTFVAYVAARVWMVLGGTVFTAHDSFVYAYRDDPALNHGPLVSLVGNAPRPWGAPIFLNLFPDDPSRAVGQWALATIVWAFLAWELTRHLRTSAARWVGFAAVLGFACLNTVANWDFTILSESLSITVGVLTVTLLLRWLRTRQTWALWVTVAAAVWWTFVRPDVRLFTATLIVLLAWQAFRARKDGARSLVMPLAAAGVLVASIGWYSAITSAMEEAFKPYDGDAIAENPLSHDEQWFLYRLRVDVSTDPELWQVYKEKLGMPDCAGTEAFATRSTWDAVEFAREAVKCPELRQWVAEHKGGNFWVPLAKAAPGELTTKWLALISHTFGGDIYADVPQVVPAPLERLFFPSRRLGLAVVLAQLAVALALALWSRAHRVYRTLVLFATGIAATCLVSSVATVVLAAGEYRRFGIQEAVGIRVAALVLLVAALDAWLIRRGAGAAGSTVGEPAQ